MNYYHLHILLRFFAWTRVIFRLLNNQIYLGDGCECAIFETLEIEFLILVITYLIFLFVPSFLLFYVDWQ